MAATIPSSAPNTSAKPSTPSPACSPLHACALLPIQFRPVPARGRILGRSLLSAVCACGVPVGRVGLIPAIKSPVEGMALSCSLPFPSSSPSPSPNPQDLGRAGVGFLLDVAGMDESRLNPLHSSDFGLGNPGRDSTALTIVQSTSPPSPPSAAPPIMSSPATVGSARIHLAVFGKLKALAETWHPQHIVIDATGVGEGLWAMLDRAFPARVIPVKFTQQEKSEIGWRFLSIIETGRFRDHVHTDAVRLQYCRCISEILPGPLKTLRWGVPDGTRGPDGELIHDDFILADSLVAKLDAARMALFLPPCHHPGS